MEDCYSVRSRSFLRLFPISPCTLPAHKSQMDFGDGLAHSMHRLFFAFFSTGASKLSLQLYRIREPALLKALYSLFSSAHRQEEPIGHSAQLEKAILQVKPKSRIVLCIH